MLRPSDTVLINESLLLERAKNTVQLLGSTGFRPLVKRDVFVTGETGRAALAYTFTNMRSGKFISEYDAVLADKVAWVITGGDAPYGAKVPEEQILELERNAFMELLKEEKTQQRIDHMLKTGKPLRN